MNSQSLIIYLCTFVLFSAILPSIVQSQLDPDDEAKIDEFIEGLIECRGMPGVAIALVKDNEVALTKGYGFANIDRQEPVTADTVFPIASVSKSMTATLFAKIFSETDGLDWNSIVAWSSDDIVDFYNGYITNHTMFRDLLSHQTGIPRYDAIWVHEAFDTRDEFTKRSHLLNPLWDFRSDLLYTNIMYTLASHPIEIRRDSTFEELLRELLLNPIGMESTVFYDEADESGYNGFATPYNWDLLAGSTENLTEVAMDIWKGSYLVGPAASVCSTANDFSKWMRFILNGGITADGTVIINQEDLDRLWYPESTLFYSSALTKPFAPVSDTTDSYGLSYSNGHYRGFRTHKHGGDLPGWHSEVFFIPDMNMSTFFTTNFGGHSSERTYVHQVLADILLGIEPAYNASTVCDMWESSDNDGVEDKSLNKFARHIPSDTLDLLYNLGFDEQMINFFARQEVEGMTGMPRSVASKLSNIIESVKSVDIMSDIKVENYTGIYGDFAYGNITITPSSVCNNCLFMEYGKTGKYTLFPTEDPNTFAGINEVYNTPYTPVVFSGVDDITGQVLFASPVYFNILLPPVFERGLSMEDAPPSNIDSCN